MINIPTVGMFGSPEAPMHPIDVPSLTIDPSARKHDGLCARVCPMGIASPCCGDVDRGLRG